MPATNVTEYKRIKGVSLSSTLSITTIVFHNIILDTARKSAVYFLLSFFCMFTGLLFCLSTFLKTTKKIFSFFSGVSYVVGGKCVLD